MCRKQAEIEWARRGISIVACCHSVKLSILAVWAFQSQQSGALTKMWRWCQVQPSQKECAIGAVHCKKEGRCCNLSVDVALKVRFTTNGMCAKSNTQIYVTWTSDNRVISSGDLYYCLLPHCEALRTCHSSFLITTQELPTSLSFACQIHENGQRRTCTWI